MTQTKPPLHNFAARVCKLGLTSGPILLARKVWFRSEACHMELLLGIADCIQAFAEYLRMFLKRPLTIWQLA
jgi:hypothetical protein